MKWIILSIFILSLNFYAESKNYVFNKTNIKDADYFIYVGLDILKIDSATVLIKPLIDNLEYEAYVDGKDRQYIIYINEKSKNDFFKILSHEIIHIKQYYFSELIINGVYVIWMGEYFEYEYLDYEDRPWENEAYLKGNQLYKAIHLIF